MIALDLTCSSRATSLIRACFASVIRSVRYPDPLLRLCFFGPSCPAFIFRRSSFLLRFFRHSRFFRGSWLLFQGSFRRRLCAFRCLRGAFLRGFCLCAFRDGFSSGFSLNRLCARCGFASSLPLHAALVEAVDGLIDFVHHLFADSRNFHQLLRGHRGKLLHGINSRGFHLLDGLGAHDRQRSQRSGGGCEPRHFRFDFLALLLFALDVDVPADELARQPDVLPLLADCQRELRIFDDHFQVLVLRVSNLYARYFCRAQSLLRERHGLFAIGNDVDFFAAQLADDGLHAHAFHPHACANGVNVLVAAHYCHFGTLARFARRMPDLHGAVVNFRHFHFEQPLHQARIRAGHDNLRPLRRAIHCLDDNAQPLANIVSFELRLFALRQPRFGPPHIHNHVGAFGALDDYRHQFAHASVVLVENGVTLSFSHLLQNHLLGRLCRNAPKHVRRLRGKDFRADLSGRILFLRFRQRNFFFRVGHFLNHREHRIHVHLPRFRVELAAQVFLGLIKFPGRHHHRIFNRRHHHFRLDVLLAAQHLDLLVKQTRHIASLIPRIPALSLKTLRPNSPCESFPAAAPPYALPCLATPRELSHWQTPPAVPRKTSPPPPAPWW